MQCLLEWLGYADSEVVRSTMLGIVIFSVGNVCRVAESGICVGHFTTLKSCDQYKKSILWSSVAHFA